MSKFRKLPRIILNNKVYRLKINSTFTKCEDCAIFKNKCNCMCFDLLRLVNGNIGSKYFICIAIDENTDINDKSVVYNYDTKEWNQDNLEYYEND